MAARKNDSVSLGEALRAFIENNQLEKGLTRIEARDAWIKLMGPGVNNYTSEVVLKGDTLLVSLTSSVLRDELSYGKEKIIKMINEELGKDVVQKLILR